MASLNAFLRLHRSIGGYRGQYLIAGALLMLVACAVFAGIAIAVAGAGAITVIDVDIAQWLHGHANPAITKLMLIITHMHSVPGIIVLSMLVGIVIARKREWYWLLALTVSVGGGMLINVLAKHAFQRVRPIFDQPFLVLTTYSFPSGHAVGATVFYGALTAYLFCHIHSWRWRATIAAIAFQAVLVVGFSCMYLG